MLVDAVFHIDRRRRWTRRDDQAGFRRLPLERPLVLCERQTFLKIKLLTMLQIAVIRENRNQVIAALAKRNMDAVILVDTVLDLDEKRKKNINTINNDKSF